MNGVSSISFGAKFAPERLKKIANATAAELASAINQGLDKVGAKPPRPINGNTLRQVNMGFFDGAGRLKPEVLDVFDKTCSDIPIKSNQRLHEYTEAVAEKAKEIMDHNCGDLTRRFDIFG